MRTIFDSRFCRVAIRTDLTVRAVKIFAGYKSILLGVLIIFVLSACTGEADLIQINQQRGREIAVALEAYEEAHGRLPDRLEALAPAYLADIPKTVKGEDFDYRLIEEAGYYLSFEVEENLRCSYDPDFKMWECSGEAP